MMVNSSFDDSSWRKDYLDTKARLSKRQIELLENGPDSLSSAWVLGAMYRDWQSMKGILKREPEPPDCQSSLGEFFKKQEDIENG